MNVGNLDESSLTKTFHIFIFWGKTEGYSERGLWHYYSVCYCGKCYTIVESVRSRRRVVPAKGARLREDVHFVGRANMICRLLSTQRIVPLDGLKTAKNPFRIRRNIPCTCLIFDLLFALHVQFHSFLSINIKIFVM